MVGIINKINLNVHKNICCSAAEEYIIRQKLGKKKINDAEVKSAGIYNLYGASRTDI